MSTTTNVSGSNREPTPGPDQVVEQMREATERLREQAWMVVPLTSAHLTPAVTDDASPAER